MSQQLWLALIIGNSRWHWGAFAGEGHGQSRSVGAASSQGAGAKLGFLGDRWLGGWHTPPLSEPQAQLLQHHHFAGQAWRQIDPSIVLPVDLGDIARDEHPELWLASVVDAPLAWLADYPNLHPIQTAQVPLQNTYPTLGVDRALALVGAGDIWHWPVLVIDCGTALTFTAGVDQGLVGGAILPGLRLQYRALHEHTDQLPAIAGPLGALPDRWANDTAGAIASGIVHTQLAGIRDFAAAWEADWPGSAVVLTGGDSAPIFHWLMQQSPALAQRMQLDPDLGFWGVRVCRRHSLKRPTGL